MLLGVITASINAEERGLPEGSTIISAIVFCLLGYAMVYSYQFSEKLKSHFFPKKVPTILKNS